MHAIRATRATVLPLKTRAVLRDRLRKQIERTVISVHGVPHRLRIVGVRQGAQKPRLTFVITVTTDNTREEAHVHIASERLDYPDFVVSLLAHAMRAVLTNELPPDAIEAL